MRQLDDLKPAEIKAAVAALMPGLGQAESWQILETVAQRLGSSKMATPGGYQHNAVLDRYVGRVKRALDALAADGVLVRVGAKDQPPDGTSPGDVHYYTPEAYAAAKSWNEERLAALKAQAEYKDELRTRLRKAGIEMGDSGNFVSVPLTDMKHLLDLAGL
jgi:hypothetical protein